MGLDLTGLQSFVEDELMDDDVIIFRDPSGTTDDTWDAETGTYDPEGSETIYEGDAWISSANQQPLEVVEGGITKMVSVYFVNIPLGADEILNGDMIKVRASLRMPQLVDKWFCAESLGMGTFKVKQKIRMVRTVPQALR